MLVKGFVLGLAPAPSPAPALVTPVPPLPAPWYWLTPAAAAELPAFASEVWLLRKLSVKIVSLCRPAMPFSEKWVTLMGRDTFEGERGVSRLEMVSRSTLAGGEDTVVVVRVGELSTSIS